jgi:hypothetical protein
MNPYTLGGAQLVGEGGARDVVEACARGVAGVEVRDAYRDRVGHAIGDHE